MFDERLEEELRRSPSGTREALVRFNESKDPGDLEIFARGILARNIDDEYLEVLEKASGETNIFEDLGIDSLTMAEIIVTFEDGLGIKLIDDEVIQLRTLGEIQEYLMSKVTEKAHRPSADSAS